MMVGDDGTGGTGRRPGLSSRDVTRQFSFASRRGGLPTGRGGLFALSWPLITIALALGSMRGEVRGLTDPAAPLVAGLLFVLAAPTTWLFALARLAPVVTVVLGVVTSFPLWFLLGSRLAAASWTWGEWWRRYAAWAIGWAVVAMILLAAIASFSE
jgi:hypothetical protein